MELTHEQASEVLAWVFGTEVAEEIIKGKVVSGLYDEGDRPRAQVSWESAPGKTTRILPGFAHYPFDVRQEFHNNVKDILFPQGRDLLAETFGLPYEGAFNGIGAFEGETNPGSQSVIVLPHNGPLDDDLKAKISAYASGLGHLLSQDAMAWHYPVKNGPRDPRKESGVDVDLGRPASQDEVKALYDTISQMAGHSGYSPIATQRGVRFLHFPGEGEDEGDSNLAFHDLVRNAVSRAWGNLPDDEIKAGSFAWDGDYIGNRWDTEEQHNGEGYLDRIAAAGSSDLFGRLARTLGGRIGQEQKQTRANNRYHPGFDFRDGEINPDEARREIALEHWSRDKRSLIDPARQGSGQPGGERARMTDPNFIPRTYYYVEGTVPEPRFQSSTRHRISVPAAIYDMAHDPAGIRQKISDPNNQSEYERAIAAHGWDGIASRHQPHVVQLFRPVRIGEDGKGTLLSPDMKELPVKAKESMQKAESTVQERWYEAAASNREALTAIALQRAAQDIRHCGDYGDLYWHPKTQTAHWTMADSDGDGKEFHNSAQIKEILGKVKGVKKLQIGDEWSPKTEEGWQRLDYRKLAKKAAAVKKGRNLQSGNAVVIVARSQKEKSHDLRKAEQPEGVFERSGSRRRATTSDDEIAHLRSQMHIRGYQPEHIEHVIGLHLNDPDNYPYFDLLAGVKSRPVDQRRLEEYRAKPGYVGERRPGKMGAYDLDWVGQPDGSWKIDPDSAKVRKAVRRVRIRKAFPIDALSFDPTGNRAPLLPRLGAKHRVTHLASREHPPTEEHPPMRDMLVHRPGWGHWNHFVLRTYNPHPDPEMARTYVFPANDQGRIMGSPIHITEPGLESEAEAHTHLSNLDVRTLRAHHRNWNKNIRPLVRPASAPGTATEELVRPASPAPTSMSGRVLLRASQEPAQPVLQRSVVIVKAALGTREVYQMPDKKNRTHEVVRPLTNAAFEQHIKPSLPAGYADTLEDYLNLHPENTHYKMRHSAAAQGEASPLESGEQFLRAGPLEALRPSKGKKVDTYQPEAVPDYEGMHYGADKEVTPLTIRAALAQHFNLTTKQAEGVSEMLHAWASNWARKTNKKPEDWFNTRLAGIGSGYTLRDRALKRAADNLTLGHDHLDFNGLPPSAWTSQDMEKFGQMHDIPHFGPQNPEMPVIDDHGVTWHIPGGLDGHFSYLDKMALKSKGYDPSKMGDKMRVKLYQKLTRSAHPMQSENPEDTHVENFNRLLFGLTSPNAPLTPQEFAFSRFRAGNMGDIALLSRYADLLPPNPSREDNNWVAGMIRRDFGIGAQGEGGLGVASSVNYGNIATLAKQFMKNPQWFAKRPEENWDQFSERIGSQVNGLGTKTASFGTVWQDTHNAEAMAVDRHIADKYFREAPEMEPVRQQMLDEWNDNRNSVEAQKKLIEQQFKDAEIDRDEYQHLMSELQSRHGELPKFQRFDDFYTDPIGANKARNYMTDQLKAQKLLYRTKKGKAESTAVRPGETYDQMLQRAGFHDQLLATNQEGSYRYSHLLPSHPVHNPQGADWIDEPDQVQVMSPMYRQVLDFYRNEGRNVGLNPFPYQWMVWDMRRHRLEPHEVMHPGMHRIPRMSRGDVMIPRTEHSRAGYFNSAKDPETWELAPGRPMEQSQATYFQGSPMRPRAVHNALRDGRAVLQALENPDLSSALHEVGHILRKDLSGNELKAVEDWLKIPGGHMVAKADGTQYYQPGDWHTGHEEKFARAIERYFHEANAPTTKLGKVFNYFKDWMGALYPSIQKISGENAREETKRSKQIVTLQQEQQYLTEQGKQAEADKIATQITKLQQTTGKDIYAKSPLDMKLSADIKVILDSYFGADKAPLSGKPQDTFALVPQDFTPEVAEKRKSAVVVVKSLAGQRVGDTNDWKWQGSASADLPSDRHALFKVRNQTAQDYLRKKFQNAGGMQPTPEMLKDPTLLPHQPVGAAQFTQLDDTARQKNREAYQKRMKDRTSRTKKPGADKPVNIVAVVRNQGKRGNTFADALFQQSQEMDTPTRPGKPVVARPDAEQPQGHAGTFDKKVHDAMTAAQLPDFTDFSLRQFNSHKEKERAKNFVEFTQFPIPSEEIANQIASQLGGFVVNKDGKWTVKYPKK